MNIMRGRPWQRKLCATFPRRVIVEVLGIPQRGPLPHETEFTLFFFFFLTASRWTLIMQRPSSLSFPIVPCSKVFTLLKALNERSTVHNVTKAPTPPQDLLRRMERTPWLDWVVRCMTWWMCPMFCLFFCCSLRYHGVNNMSTCPLYRVGH